MAIEAAAVAGPATTTGWTLHDDRTVWLSRTGAGLVREHGRDLVLVADLLAHLDAKTTARYARSTVETTAPPSRGPKAWRLVNRLARSAGLKSAGRLSPHSLGHTFATSLDAAGVPLQDIQDAMGRADPRTTRRYTATHQHLDCHATYASAASLRRPPARDQTRVREGVSE